MTTYEQFNDWLAIGREQGWISDLVCSTHDGTPMTEEEEAEWDEGSDPCAFVVRVWTERIEA